MPWAILLLISIQRELIGGIFVHSANGSDLYLYIMWMMKRTSINLVKHLQALTIKRCVCVCVCVCEFLSTVNRGHTPKLHHKTEDNIANEDGPGFVDTCKRLQIAYSCI